MARAGKPTGRMSTPQVQSASAYARLASPAPGPQKVRYAPAPAPASRSDSIHPRRILPKVREGREREFHSATRALSLTPPAMRASGPAGADLVISVNTPLPQPAGQRLASNVGEPSLAANGDVVFFTGNWYAARSLDGGRTFEFLDPFTAFQNPPNLQFCCDQVVQYVASIDTFVWLMQYSPQQGPQADNIQRLAFATTQELRDGQWRIFDITTTTLGVPGLFLDYPDIAVGANAIYITTNVFTPAGQLSTCAVLRIGTASIASGAIVAKPFVPPDGNGFRVAQNCGATAYFAAHQDTSTLKVFAWDEDKDAPTSQLVEVARWVGGSGYASRCPDGSTWLDRADPRITGAALAGGDLYFAWGVDGGSNRRKQPFIQIARIEAATLTLVENINVFDDDSATCYAALAVNADKEVGISYMLGGGPKFPSHVVGILTGDRRDVVAAVGEAAPQPNQQNRGEWGDYLAARPVYPEAKLFAASGYTLPAGAVNGQSLPRYVVFGRTGTPLAAIAGGGAAGAVAVAFSRPPMPGLAKPDQPDGDGEPIASVDDLGVVSAAVAEKIKFAAGLDAVAARAAPAVATAELAAAVRPGTERWRVKTGQDGDRAKVGKNVIDGEDLGRGVVEATIDELSALPRPPGLEVATADPPQFQGIRNGVAEVTIWRVVGKIIAIKHETDGDYHLVLQSDSGAEMVAEVPTPTEEFVGDCPWLDDIRKARQAIDDGVVRSLSPADFSLLNGKLAPHSASLSAARALPPPGLLLTTPPPGSKQPQPLFQSAIPPRRARITGVGFFDRAHGQTGAAKNVIELHPVLKVEWM